MDINKYFKDEGDKQKLFIGNKLIVTVPKFYEQHGFLSISNTVQVLGILNLNINSSVKTNLIITNMLEMAPSDIDNDQDNYYFTFYKNDPFLVNRFIIKGFKILYRIFVVFFRLGKIPKFLEYEDVVRIFDNTKEINDVTLHVGREIFSMQVAHIFRDSKDPSKFYRLTDMKKEPKIVGLGNVLYSPLSATAKMLGSYFDDGLTGAMLIYDEEGEYDIEKALLK